ncbi:MAG: F0F1 ATP synthase subunit B [Actinomycetota bacterium]|jgi:F-type H+-transporting ATPase subunit b
MRWFVLAAESGESGGTFTDINFATALWTWVAFVVAYLVLSRLAWPRLAASLEERELRIAEGLRKADEAEARARQLMEQRQRLLDESRKEAQQLLASARAEAEQRARAVLLAAQQELAEERKRAKQEVALERARATEELKQAAVDLTLLTASRILQRNLHDDLHQRVARDIVDEVANARAHEPLVA